MLKANLILSIAIAAVTLAAWAWLTQPIAAPAWPSRVEGFAFSPLRPGQDPAHAEYPTREQLDADLALVAAEAHSIRTYSLAGTLADIPELAARHGLGVTLGVWLGKDRTANAAELAKLREVMRRARNVTRVIIGNEVLLRRDLPLAELTGILDAARRELDVPVGTAEPWNVWMTHPELAQHVDFIAVHLLPYWEGVDVDHAVDYVNARVDALATAYPGKHVVIGEVGWPSWGRTYGRAVASHPAAAAFLRRFLARAEDKGYDYFLLEAFDQPWKRADEGEVGAYWGFFDASRQPKFSRAGPITVMPHRIGFAFLAAALGLAAFRLLVADGARLRLPGRVFLALLGAAAGNALSWTAADCGRQYWSVHDVLGAALVGAGLLGIAVQLLIEAHEWAEARWAALRRARLPAGANGPRHWPKVSIHVPACREPPEMLVETLRALAQLDYPDFEVIVVDNNTDEERLWRPVETYCAALGERFRFFHVAPLAGYKAGALNFALRRTATDAEVVAVIDSDYCVTPDWLRELVPALDEPDIAIVQAPQAYRDGERRLFKKMCAAEYRGFFRIGMVTRNERNAIIQHGTMSLVKRQVLEEVGGWGEWTITEDAELGLRVLEHGYRALYTPRCYGRGLTPDNFLDYKAQRYRWALGAMQILKRHGRALLGIQRGELGLAQRYHFLSGWLPWLGDAANLLFTVLAVFWSLAMIAAPARFHPPAASLSAFVLTLYAFKLVKVAALYRTAVRATVLETLGAAVAGLALVQIVGIAVFTGLFRREACFRRTPKLAERHGFKGALAAALPETILSLSLAAAACGVAARAPLASNDSTLWCALLVVAALPHAAALTLSLISAAPHRTHRAAAIGDAVAGEQSG
ncbi:MAG TPA: glycosyltransferase family 2 protein [Gammaproteobacteria bacterium]|nr:glycosyltransferase family 2 protein [Gammaproteobacteria bacterium]